MQESYVTKSSLRKIIVTTHRLSGKAGNANLQTGVHYKPTFAKKVIGERFE